MRTKTSVTSPKKTASPKKITEAHSSRVESRREQQAAKKRTADIAGRGNEQRVAADMLDIARLPRCDHHGDHLSAGEQRGERMARFVDKDHENFNRIEKRRMPEEE